MAELGSGILSLVYGRRSVGAVRVLAAGGEVVVVVVVVPLEFVVVVVVVVPDGAGCVCGCGLLGG